MKLRYILILLVLVMAMSCTKDEDVKGVTASKTDSISVLNASAPPGNILAVAGTLKITVKDSTCIFDAKDDSIAVVNLFLENKKYFGITAINKAHTMSFGISAPGYATNRLADTVAGSQLLFNSTANPNIEYTLSRNGGIPGPGTLVFTQYKQDSVLAKGTFFTYLSKDVNAKSVFYKVEGSFSLKMK